MRYSIENSDYIWFNNKKPIKIWATSMRSYNNYIDDTKYRFNLLCGYDTPIEINEIDHVEIIRDQAKYYFKENVSKYSGQFLINNYFYNYCRNYICANYLISKDKKQIT